MGGTTVGFYLGTQLFQALGAARSEYHLRAGLGQHLGKPGAEAARGAGHQRDFSLKIDFYAHGSSSV